MYLRKSCRSRRPQGRVVLLSGVPGIRKAVGRRLALVAWVRTVDCARVRAAMDANLPLHRIKPLLYAADTSILHIACGSSHVAIATSSNSLLLMAAGEPPLERQVQWFAGADNGIASMAMRDDTDLLVVTHNASVYVLPLWQVLRRPPMSPDPHEP